MNYLVGQNPKSIAIGDFNKDNRLDIVVANGNSNSIGVLLGYASESIEQKTTLITGKDVRPQSFAIRDFDNDDRMDIAVANSASNTVGIFFGYNNYSFTPQLTYGTGPGSSPRSIAVDDFNQDNCLDIVVANRGSDNIGVFYGNGDRSFSSQKTFSTGSKSEPYSITVA